MLAVLPSQLTPVAAVDPIAIFIAFIIIVNVISALTKRARLQSQAPPAAETQAQPSTSSVADAMRKASADLAAARAAQRARLEQAIRAAQQQAQQMAARDKAAQQVATPAPTMPRSSSTMTVSPQQPVALPTASNTLQPEMLPSFAYAADVSTGLMPLTSITPAVSAPTTLPILNDRLTLADLFVASAIVGPPASIRPPGHTPAGW
jgi:hypothetical protein